MRISVPSYIIPGTYAENLRFIAEIGEITNVELLFFLFDKETDLLFEKEEGEIREFRRRFTYTIHLPDTLKPEHEVLVKKTEDFVDSYVVHPPKKEETEFIDLLNHWRGLYGNRFYLENLITRPNDDFLTKIPDLPACLDTGHMLLRGDKPAGFTQKFGSRIKEIHLHGINGGKDHHPFDKTEEWFQDLQPFLRDYDGIVTIELFDEKQVRKILPFLTDLRDNNNR